LAASILQKFLDHGSRHLPGLVGVTEVFARNIGD
jgi:hypothetical protein